MTEKRYFISVVEEMILNPKFKGYRGGRIEVTDKQSDDHFPREYHFFIPEEFYEGFVRVFDFKESDKPVYISWAMERDL